MRIFSVFISSVSPITPFCFSVLFASPLFLILSIPAFIDAKLTVRHGAASFRIQIYVLPGKRPLQKLKRPNTQIQVFYLIICPVLPVLNMEKFLNAG